MRVLLLSAYDAGSHRYWREGLAARLPDIDWTVLSLPPRYFNWRVRGNPLSWYGLQRDCLSQNYDLLLATSMVDVATLKGLFPHLAGLPTLVYYHENQFAYPDNSRQTARLEAQMVSLYNGLAADIVSFNSDYNRRTFLQGARQLIKKLPDYAPASVIDNIEEKSQLLAVPIDDHYFVERHTDYSQPLTLVWNHRWEYDKAPERLAAALTQLQQKNITFRLHLIGEQFRNIPPVFRQMRESFNEQLLSFGYVDNLQQYRQILSSCDAVISTSIHEFQGLSILKAVASGCLPVVPDRLSYQELFPKACRYGSFQDPDQEATALAKHLEILSLSKTYNSLPAPPKVNHLAWSGLLHEYRQLIYQFAG